MSFESLTAELQAYCDAHALPQMSADELACEVYAVISGEFSHYVAPSTSSERHEELTAAWHWLCDFLNRWDDDWKQPKNAIDA